MATANIYSNLPRVIEVLAIDDAGEFGAANCPHCGAEGRYVYHFTCDDGQEHGAMRGCFSKFPQHPFAKEMARILEKERRIRHDGRGTLASWDQTMADAIRAFAAGQMSEDEAEARINSAKRTRDAWLKRRRW